MPIGAMRKMERRRPEHQPGLPQARRRFDQEDAFLSFPLQEAPEEDNRTREADLERHLDDAETSPDVQPVPERLQLDFDVDEILSVLEDAGLIGAEPAAEAVTD